MSLDLEDRLRRYGDTFEHAATASENVGRGVEPRSKRRVHGRRRLVASAILVGVAVIGTVAVPRLFGSDPKSGHVELGTTPANGESPQGSTARPVLDGCTPTTAFERVVRGTSDLQGPKPFFGEVFADPTRAIAGPLAIVIRDPDARGLGLIANAEINGRDANVDIGENLQGGATWVLASGGTAYLYSRGLTEDEIRVLAEDVDSGGTALPQNLGSIGMTDVASISTSMCTDQQGEIASISEIQGSRPSRYAEAMNIPGTRRFDDGDTSFVIGGFPGRGFDATNATYHEATPQAWQHLLDATSAAEHDNSSTTTTAP
jgi:hypothetical protein